MNSPASDISIAASSVVLMHKTNIKDQTFYKINTFCMENLFLKINKPDHRSGLKNLQFMKNSAWKQHIFYRTSTNLCWLFSYMSKDHRWDHRWDHRSHLKFNWARPFPHQPKLQLPTAVCACSLPPVQLLNALHVRLRRDGHLSVYKARLGKLDWLPMIYWSITWSNRSRKDIFSESTLFLMSAFTQEKCDRFGLKHQFWHIDCDPLSPVMAFEVC